MDGDLGVLAVVAGDDAHATVFSALVKAARSY
jgi:hypothetical protein